MWTWALVELAKAAGHLGSAKVNAFLQAQTAGITLPPSVVLIRVHEAENVASEASLHDALAERFMRLGCVESKELVLRSIAIGAERAWRAMSVRLTEIQVSLDRLVERHPDINTVLVQTRCRIGEESSIVTWSSIGVGASSSSWGYRENGTRNASGFDTSSPEFDRVARTHRQLEEAVGASVQARYSVGAREILLLSVWCSPFPLSAQAEVAVRKARLGEGTRMAAIMAVAAAIDGGSSTLRLADDSARKLALVGRSIGRGWTTGRAAFSAKAQARFLANGDPAILVKDILSSSDVGAIRKASGVLATSEGVSSHLALLANSLGKPCIVDVKDAHVLVDSVLAQRDGRCVFREGEWITLDEHANTLLPTRAEQNGASDEIPEDVLSWALSTCDRSLLANCERAEEVLLAERIGVQGVGLCRSERHLILSVQGVVAFRAAMLSRDRCARTAAIEDVCRVLGGALEALLQASRTKRICYRLLDPDPYDFGLFNAARGSAASKHAASPLIHTEQPIGRGAVFRRNFEDLYQQQIATVIAVAEQVALRTHSAVNLALVVPMVSDAVEYLGWIRQIRSMSTEAEARCGDLLTIRVGAMIETPRGAIIAADLAKVSEVLLVGTNDLTATVWGIDRFTRQSTHGFSFNPLQEFDATVVGRLIATTVADARCANHNLTITVCGAHASNPKDSSALLNTGVDGLSCSLSNLPRIALELAQLSGSGAHRVTPPPFSTSTKLFGDVMTEAMPRIENGPDLPQRHAALGDWAAGISADLGISWSGVWKFFKRDLVGLWFGEREVHRFMPPWKVADALEYALSIQERTGARIRFSVFPPDIACRAYSETLTEPVDPSAWQRQLAELKSNVPMELFPQQAQSRTAFRAILRAQTLFIEGAPGQAIDVFWKAPTDLFSLEYDGCTAEVRASESAQTFAGLLRQHMDQLFARAASLRDYLGVEWISVEGYAGPEPEAPLFVADVDLPVDAALIDTKARPGS